MRRIVRGVGVLVAALASASLVGGCSGDPDGDDAGSPDQGAGSTQVEDDADFTIGPGTRPHRIVYRVTGGDDSVETDRFTVVDAFTSRLETARGEPPGGETVSVQVGTIDRLAIGGVDDPATVARTPGLAPSSIRVAPVLDAAVEAGLVEVREQRVVADRRCQVLRSGTTLASGALVPIVETEFADSCIDADGLLLEEELFVDGDLAFRRTAVDVDVDPAVDDAEFVVGDPTAPVDQGGGDTSPADPATAPIGPFFSIPGDAVPDGFRLQGRYSVIPPQPDRFADPTLRDGIVAGVADVYVDGDDFFVVYQGGTLGQVEAFAPTPGSVEIDAGDVGRGELVLSARGSEMRVPLERGRFVHVVGPLDPETLVAVAVSLVESEGSGLVLLEE